MIIQLLSMLDLICVFALFSGNTEVMSICGIYLIIKGGLFALLGDGLSVIDVIIGLYLIVACFGISFGLITILCLFYLTQKAFMSFI